MDLGGPGIGVALPAPARKARGPGGPLPILLSSRNSPCAYPSVLSFPLGTSPMKSPSSLLLALGSVLVLLIPSASAEILYDKEGIQLQGSARIVSRNAATCNVLEENYSPEEYEKLKANQGQSLHVWRIDFSAHNHTGKPLDFLTASFFIEASNPPCTNWSGEGPGGGPAGDFTDDEGIRGHPLPGDQLRVLSRPDGMTIGEVERDTDFLVVFHPHKPVFKNWSVNFTFARAGARDPAAAQPAGQDPPGRPRIQLPPDILADKYLRQAEQLVRDKDTEGARKAMEELLALQQEHGLEPNPEDHFRYAQVWSAAGVPERAMEAGVRYLQLQGREAAHYNEALDLVNRAEAERARAESGQSALAGSQPGSSGIRVGESVVFDGMEFVGIPPGEFLMGSTSWLSGEEPVTRVQITKGFYLGKYEVTQDQWQAVMGSNPSLHKRCGENCPVEQVSREDVQVFIRKLNGMSGGERYRLPTEAEWEYAARAGTTTDTYAGDITIRHGEEPVLDSIAWYDASRGEEPKAVGQKEPNGWGVYDMLGNVGEWVADWSWRYPGGTVTDPTGPGSGSRRVHRGGSWSQSATFSTSADRGRYPPDYGDNYLGFRLLREQ